MKAAGALAACVLAAGCTAVRAPVLSASQAPPRPPVAPVVAAVPAPEPDPPSASGAPALEGNLAAGDPRPRSRSIAFDVDSLPVATWGEPLKGAGFSLRKTSDGDGWVLRIYTTLFAEVLLSRSAAWESKDPSTLGFAGFSGGRFGGGEPPDCGPGHTGQRLAVWRGIAPAGWTDDGVDVEMEEGNYDLSTCAATPKRSLHGRAIAVVRGYVYALLARDEADDDGDADESVVVFLPPGTMVSASANPTMPLETSNTGPFTRLTLPLDPGEPARPVCGSTRHRSASGRGSGRPGDRSGTSRTPPRVRRRARICSSASTSPGRGT